MHPLWFIAAMGFAALAGWLATPHPIAATFAGLICVGICIKAVCLAIKEMAP